MESKTNNTIQPLAIGQTWSGISEFRNNTVTITVNLITTKNCVVFVEQSTDNVNFVFVDQYAHEIDIIGNQSRFQVSAKAQYMRVKVTNVSGQLIPQIIVTTYYIDVNKDSTLEQPSIVAGSVSVLNGMKATDYEFNTLRDVACNDTGNLLVNVNNNVVVQGINNNFEFFPTATNNTATVYADGTKGTDVAGGWQYANTLTDKINWYCYSSAGLATDYKVSQLNSMYTVINQQSTLGLTLAQNPWIMIYTRMDSGTNSGSFFKSKLFFGVNAHTDINGIKLLYTGSDPTHIHPEITGINRIQLLFNSALSNDKQLANVQNESILAGSLQTTNNTSPVNSFFFTMQEFGCDWVKAPSTLPIEFNKVKCDVSGSVAVSSGAITETNSGTISSTLTTLNGKVTACNTGAVVVSSALPTGDNVIGKIITFESSSSAISLTNISTVGQTIKNSPGSLFNLTVFNDGNAISYLKIYNVAIPTSTDTPVITLPIRHDNALNSISIHNYQFSTAIGIRATANFIANDTTAPNGTTSITAFYNGLSP
jgi:hypothetical protein